MTDRAVNAPADWRPALERVPRRLDPSDLGDLVVVAAHPDDETLGVSGVMQSVHLAGGRVELIIATDGEAAFPDLGPTDRAQLATTRRAELSAALRAQGLESVDVRWLGLPDSALDSDELAAALRPLLADADSVLTPWEHDPHPDHAAAGRAGLAAAPATAQRWSYPIWMWAWTAIDDRGIPWDDSAVLALTDPIHRGKQSAITCFRSQLVPGPAGPAILPPKMLAHFNTDREIVFRHPIVEGAPIERFGTLYGAADGDPWSTRSSWYESRKRSVLLATLPRERYKHCAEPACGTGALTQGLAERCDAVTATDFVEAAVEATTAATSSRSGVRVARATLPTPEAVPDGIDLAVLSEVLYYLGDADLDASIDRVADALRPGGDVVIAHWRGWPADAPRDAVTTHRRLIEDDRFDQLVEHVDEEFLLHVLRRR